MNRFASLLIGIALAFAAVQASAFAGDAQDEKAKIQQLQAQAEEKEAKGYYASAAKLYHKVGKRQTEHRLKAQAYLKEADCLFEAGKTFNATKAYKELMKEYALYVPFERVVGNLRKLAEDFVDGKGTLFGVRDKSEAIDTYFFILTEAPSIAVSLSDRLRLAELLVKEKRREEAVMVYQEILKLDPMLDDVRLEMALVLLDLCKNGDGDGSIRRAATRHAKIILDHNPDYKRKEELELILAEAVEEEAGRLLELGRFYLRSVHLNPAASKKYLLELVQKFPGTKAAWEAKNMLETDSRLKNADAKAAEGAK